MRLAAIVLVLGVCGCGGPHREKAVAPVAGTPTPPPATPAADPAEPAAAVDPAVACRRFAELQAARCGLFARVSIGTPAECTESLRRELAGGQGAFVEGMSRCALDHAACDEIDACIAALPEPDVAPTDLRACGDDAIETPVGIPADEFARRNGAGVTRYRDARSTKDRPIEQCGISAANEWLVGLACDDGSHPIRDHQEAEVARAGNVGPGGRCGAIVDLYEVACPEGSYDVYVDAYVCPRP